MKKHIVLSAIAFALLASVSVGAATSVDQEKSYVFVIDEGFDVESVFVIKNYNDDFNLMPFIAEEPLVLQFANGHLVIDGALYAVAPVRGVQYACRSPSNRRH